MSIVREIGIAVKYMVDQKSVSDAKGSTNNILGALGKLAKRAAVTAGVTALPAYALKTGFERLYAIDDAKSKLKALGKTTPVIGKNIQTIMKNSLTSVQGTAFGLEEAATTATGAVAAGIKPGKQLLNYLNLTADTAAIAGTSMQDMGIIMNRVTANGKLSSEEMNELADRGIPIWDYLAKQTHQSVSQVRDDVSKGTIDIKTFQAALQKNVGGAAKNMGKISFSAAWDNFKASITRIGANFLNGDNMKGNGLFAHITPALNAMTNMLAPLETKAKVAGQIIGKVVEFVAKGLLYAKNHADALKPAIDTIKASIEIAGGMIRKTLAACGFSAKKAFSTASFGKGILLALKAVLYAIAGAINIVGMAISAVIVIVKGVIIVIKWIISAIKAVYHWLTRANTSTKKSSDAASGATKKYATMAGGMKSLSSVIKKAGSAMTAFAHKISSGASKALSAVRGMVSKIGTALGGLAKKGLKWGSDFMSGFKDGVAKFVDGVIDKVKGLAEKIKSHLHFSRPDEGPLRDYETWMPDFMKGLASGIDNNSGMVIERVKSLAGKLSSFGDDMSIMVNGGNLTGRTLAFAGASSAPRSVVQNVTITNTYNGGSREIQKNVSTAMNKSSTDATSQMARALAAARG